MDPVTLAVVTTAVTTLAQEGGKAAVSEAAKDAWKKVKSLFGWSEAPATDIMPKMVAEKLQSDPEVAKKVVELLQSQQVGTASALVTTVNAEKVIVIQSNSGSITM